MMADSKLIISSLFDGATDAAGCVLALETLAEMATQLEAAGREVGDMLGPVTDPVVIARIESAQVTLVLVTQMSQRLSRLLSRAVLRAVLP